MLTEGSCTKHSQNGRLLCSHTFTQHFCRQNYPNPRWKVDYLYVVLKLFADIREVFDTFDFWDGRDGMVDASKVPDLLRCTGISPTLDICLKHGASKYPGQSNVLLCSHTSLANRFVMRTWLIAKIKCLSIQVNWFKTIRGSTTFG